MKNRKAVDLIKTKIDEIHKNIEGVKRHLWEIQRLAIEGKNKAIWAQANKALKGL